MENLEAGSLEYETVGEFLANLKKDFRKEDNETIKMIELKRIEQENKTIEEFIQELRRIARGSKYKGRLLVEEFKRRMNRVIKIDIGRRSGEKKKDYKEEENKSLQYQGKIQWQML